MSEAKRQARRARAAAWLRLLAALAWLVAVLLFFRDPLALAWRPAAGTLGLDALLERPAAGFLLRATSVPPGGLLFVDDTERGRLPLFANVPCREGDKVRLTVVAEGWTGWEREVECRTGETLIVRARLGK